MTMNVFGTLTNLITKEVHEITTYNRMVNVYDNEIQHSHFELTGVTFRNSKPNIRVQGPYLLHIYDGNEDGYNDFVIKFLDETYDYTTPHTLNYKVEQVDNFEAMRLAGKYGELRNSVIF